MLHIGHIIREEFDKMPKGCTITWLAKQLNCHRSNIYDIFERPTIDTQLLLRISQVMHHDFFKYLSESIDSEPE